MSETKQKQPVIVQTKKVLEVRPEKKRSQTRNNKLIFGVMIIGISLSIFSQRLISQNWQYLSEKIFGFHTLANNLEKLNVLKQTMVYLALLELAIIFAIMSIRVGGQKISPVGQKDPLSISLLNRIVSNNLEQSLIFFGLYSYLLLSDSINLETKYIFSLPLIFIIGRLIFSFCYILATIVGISTVRSFGFAFSIGVGYLMIVELIFDKTNFCRGFLFGSF